MTTNKIILFETTMAALDTINNVSFSELNKRFGEILKTVYARWKRILEKRTKYEKQIMCFYNE